MSTGNDDQLLSWLHEYRRSAQSIGGDDHPLCRFSLHQLSYQEIIGRVDERISGQRPHTSYDGIYPWSVLSYPRAGVTGTEARSEVSVAYVSLKEFEASKR